jgi:transposase
LRPTSSIRRRGKKGTPHRAPSDPPRRRANKRKEHGTYANDRPPSISVISRETGEQRFWVDDRADRRTCAALTAENVPAGRTRLYTDEWQSYRGSHAVHASVCHGVHEWARDDDGYSRREVHCNTCEGAGMALRSYLRIFRGVHKQYVHLYVATYEAMVNAKQVSPPLIRRMCIGDLSVHTGYT